MLSAICSSLFELCKAKLYTSWSVYILIAWLLRFSFKSWTPCYIPLLSYMAQWGYDCKTFAASFTIAFEIIVQVVVPSPDSSQLWFAASIISFAPIVSS